uniref:Asparagine synthetase domain containing 1 n=1 Tax=Mus musculus TaxID=10090 RepID=M0QW65_MOUSE
MPSSGVHADGRAAPGPPHTSTAHAESLSSKVCDDGGVSPEKK